MSVVPCARRRRHSRRPTPAAAHCRSDQRLAGRSSRAARTTPTAWTQGLQLDDDGRLFESTGLRGRSTIREVDPVRRAVLRAVRLPDEQFGEGLALVGDRLIQLTWQEGMAHTWDADHLRALGTFDYEGEGWGLCFDGQRLVMSDGSDRLTFRDPATFEVDRQRAASSRAGLAPCASTSWSAWTAMSGPTPG